MAQPPKGGLVRGHDKPIHGSCAIYFPGGVPSWELTYFLSNHFLKTDFVLFPRWDIFSVPHEVRVTMIAKQKERTWNTKSSLLKAVTPCFHSKARLYTSKVIIISIKSFPESQWSPGRAHVGTSHLAQ